MIFKVFNYTLYFTGQLVIWSIFTILKFNESVMSQMFIRGTQFLNLVCTIWLLNFPYLASLAAQLFLFGLFSSRSFPLVWSSFSLLSSSCLAALSAQFLLFNLSCCSIPPVLPPFPFSFSGLTILTALLLLFDLSYCSVPPVWPFFLPGSSCVIPSAAREMVIITIVIVILLIVKTGYLLMDV